jgi:hypothetical protein
MPTIGTDALIFVGYVDHTMSFDTAGEAYSPSVAYDPYATYQGAIFTAPVTGWYDVTTSIPVLAGADSGAPAAGSAVSLQFENGAAPAASQKNYTTSGVNVMKYRNIIQMNAGDTKQLSLHTDTGTNSTKVIPGNGFIEIRRVA